MNAAPYQFIARSGLLAALSCMALALPATAGAQVSSEAAPDEAETTDDNEIVVVATRMKGQIDAAQPPIMTLNEGESNQDISIVIPDDEDEEAPAETEDAGAGEVSGEMEAPAEE